FRVAQVELADARSAERGRVGAADGEIRHWSVPSAELVRELAAKGAVVHVPTRDAGLEIAHPRRVRQQRNEQFGVRLVCVELARGRGEVEVRRVAGGGDRIGDLGSKLPAKLVADRQ